MQITFLGTNGWFDNQLGKTICTLIETKTEYIILDAGFGFAKLEKILKKDKPVYLFISHLHLDHIVGLHCLGLLPIKKLKIFGGKGIKKGLQTIINHPFAMSLKELRFPVDVTELKENKYTTPINFSCLKLEHVDYDLGYRFELENKIITYCSDTGICDNDFKLAKDADILIHECALMPGEKITWGHTNPEDAATLAKKAGVKKLYLTHFGANHYNKSKIKEHSQSVARKIFPQTVTASDDMVIKI